MAEAINYLKNLARSVLPDDMNYDFAGEARQYLQEGQSMLVIFLFSLVFIYWCYQHNLKLP